MRCDICKHYERIYSEQGYCKTIMNVLEFELDDHKACGYTPVEAVIVPCDFHCKMFELTIDN